MTERGLPIVDGAPACPFVAFEDDRDGRALAPDHRHRCFAEPRPAPRALAHQEAYCLSSAFPVCPTFQDWARREAAAARPAANDARAAHDEPPVSRPLPPRERDERHAPGTETPPPLAPRRNPPRDWAAPPPWSGSDGPPGYPDEAEAPSFLSARERDLARENDAWVAASRGLAGSRADRLAGPEPDEPLAPLASAGSFATDRAAVPQPDADEPWVEPARQVAAPVPPRRAQDRVVDRRADRGQAPAGVRPEPRRRPPEEEAAELFGPAWEVPRRYEAYPTLRTRVGIPAVPRLAVGAAALVIAAVALFFLGPMLLGLGGDGLDIGGGGGAATPSASVEPSTPAEPTPTPEPTPQVYVVAENDTMSKIAKRFDLTLEELLAANKQIKNPDRIKVGDELVIPVPAPDEEE